MKLLFFVRAVFGVMLAATLPSIAHAGMTNVSPQQCTIMQARHVITDDNPVPCARLVNVTFPYRDFNGVLQASGTIVVLDAVAPKVEALFGELMLRGIPIQVAQPLEYFTGDDVKSMNANNTSAFNGRAMTGGKSWSKHAYGVAIDINPRQNPYITQTQEQPAPTVLPAASDPEFTNRTPVRAGMAEDIVGVFYDHGFLIWGGNWKQPIDYQHFEIGSRAFIRTLIAQPRERAVNTFERYAQSYLQCVATAEKASSAREWNAAAYRAVRDGCAKKMRK